MCNKFIIFHHHLLPGGVTQVISQSISSIILNMPEVEQILLVTGRTDNAESLIKSLQKKHQKELSSPDRILTWKVVPEIDYLPADSATEAVYTRIKKKLDELPGDSLWWIHNYHLGKNPLFTRALLELAFHDNSRRMLFHIHDFPECARFENLAFLNRYCPLPRYPDLPNVRYCVINSRDRNLLLASGLDKNRVFLLHDPVPPVQSSVVDSGDARSKIDKFGKHRGVFYHSGGKQLFYPVRTIRRKNVLEAALTTQLLKQKVNLIVTLPGISAQEKHYSALVESCFSKGLVPGLFGTGQIDGAPDFTSFISVSRAVLSSSVQEGFGYLFLNALQWGVPLVARHLDILEGIESVFTGYPHTFYSSIQVPLSREKGELLRKSYFNRLKVLKDLLPRDIREHLVQEIEDLSGKDVVDFSYFSPRDQFSIIQKTAAAPSREELQSLNGELLRAIETHMERVCDDRREEVEKGFGLKAFAAELKTICDSYSSSTSSSNGPGGSEDTIIRYFATLKNLRLLYE